MNHDFVKMTRGALGLSQQEFAQIVGAHYVTISRWEAPGVDSMPSAFQAALIEKFWQAAAATDKFGLEDEASRTWAEILAADGAMFVVMALLDRAWENNG